MSLYQSIVDIQIQARKNQDKEKLSVLQLLLAEIKNERISVGQELTDEQIQQVVTRQVKRLNDSLQDFNKANRQDLIKQAEFELNILNSFLPEQISDEKLESIVKQTMAEMSVGGPGDLGKIMGKVMSQIKGQATGNRVREAVSKLLS